MLGAMKYAGRQEPRSTTPSEQVKSCLTSFERATRLSRAETKSARDMRYDVHVQHTSVSRRHAGDGGGHVRTRRIRFFRGEALLGLYGRGQAAGESGRRWRMTADGSARDRPHGER